MPGRHKNGTISFRPDGWQRELIEARIRLCGIPKKDFYARACIYSNIVVVGKKENIRKIVDELKEMKSSMEKIAECFLSGERPDMPSEIQTLQRKYLALLVTVIDLLNGAMYLFGENIFDGKETDLM